MASSTAVAQSPEEVACISEGLVCEYLKKRGLLRTLEMFNMEVAQNKVRMYPWISVASHLHPMFVIKSMFAAGC